MSLRFASAMLISVVGLVAYILLKNQVIIMYYVINVVGCDYKLARPFSVNLLNLNEIFCTSRCVWCGAALGQ